MQFNERHILVDWAGGVRVERFIRLLVFLTYCNFGIASHPLASPCRINSVMLSESAFVYEVTTPLNKALLPIPVFSPSGRRPKLANGLLAKLSNGGYMMTFNNYSGYTRGGHRPLDAALNRYLVRLSQETGTQLTLEYLWGGEIEVQMVGHELKITRANETSSFLHLKKIASSVAELKAVSEKYGLTWFDSDARLFSFNKEQILRGNEPLHLDDILNAFDIGRLNAVVNSDGGNGQFSTFTHEVNNICTTIFGTAEFEVFQAGILRQTLNGMHFDHVKLFMTYLALLQNHNSDAPRVNEIAQGLARLLDYPASSADTAEGLTRRVGAGETKVGYRQGVNIQTLTKDLQNLSDWLRKNDENRNAPVFYFHPN